MRAASEELIKSTKREERKKSSAAIRLKPRAARRTRWSSRSD